MAPSAFGAGVITSWNTLHCPLPAALAQHREVFVASRQVNVLHLHSQDFANPQSRLKDQAEQQSVPRLFRWDDSKAAEIILREQNASLESQVQERIRQTEEAQLEVPERLACAPKLRDDTTEEHIQRGASARLARQLDLSEDGVPLIKRAAPLHNVGKLGVPDARRLKAGRLTEEECALLQTAQEITLTHHER